MLTVEYLSLSPGKEDHEAVVTFDGNLLPDVSETILHTNTVVTQYELTLSRFKNNFFQLPLT